MKLIFSILILFLGFLSGLITGYRTGIKDSQKIINESLELAEKSVNLFFKVRR